MTGGRGIQVRFLGRWDGSRLVLPRITRPSKGELSYGASRAVSKHFPTRRTIICIFQNPSTTRSIPRCLGQGLQCMCRKACIPPRPGTLLLVPVHSRKAPACCPEAVRGLPAGISMSNSGVTRMRHWGRYGGPVSCWPFAVAHIYRFRCIAQARGQRQVDSDWQKKEGGRSRWKSSLTSLRGRRP